MFSDERMPVLLLEDGADMHAVTDENLTALEVAPQSESLVVARPVEFVESTES